ncbi:hypothetical protein [Mesonia sp. K7]|uniref:hypothetical protein n=1 Tax=Mesonia sp. K7 TaxID=2218606 RepID=UPI0018F25775|nr:hypothetical protein [Mesonia sp. K7]
MSDKNKIPGQDEKKTGQDEKKSKEDSAINHKANEADSKEINYQEKKRREKHQPRDSA